MLHALEKHFPGSFRWSKPEGGMLLWAEGPKGFDMGKIFWKSVQKKVVFVPGKFFFTLEGEGIETMRLNYTMIDKETIGRAIKILSERLTRWKCCNNIHVESVGPLYAMV